MPVEKSPRTDDISLCSGTHRSTPSLDDLPFALALDFLYSYLFIYLFCLILELNLTSDIRLAF